MRAFLFIVALGIATSLTGCKKEPALNPPTKTLKIMVSASGDITVERQAATLDQVSAKLAELKKSGGAVLYYRENPEGEPHPNAVKVMQLVIDNQLPIRLCVKPDFSE